MERGGAGRNRAAGPCAALRVTRCMDHLPELADWSRPEAPRLQPVDDRVMGGRSASRFRVTDQGSGIFEGVVSLENNGGFASVRAGIENVDLGGAAGVRIRARGDGSRYRLSLRNDRRLSGINYFHDFQPPTDEWGEITLAFEGFRPSFRGRTPPNAPPLDPRRIRQIGFMIADRQEGPFRLEIAWVRGWSGR